MFVAKSGDQPVQKRPTNCLSASVQALGYSHSRDCHRSCYHSMGQEQLLCAFLARGSSWEPVGMQHRGDDGNGIWQEVHIYRLLR